MLSPNENRVKELLVTKLYGDHREEALLYHSSVPRKLKAVQLFYNNITSFIPSFFTTATVSTSASPPNPPPSSQLIGAASLIDDISAYIDAFFMSGKSTLDSFAHELRSLCQFTGLTGDLYFENALDQLSRNHPT